MDPMVASLVLAVIGVYCGIVFTMMDFNDHPRVKVVAVMTAFSFTLPLLGKLWMTVLLS